MESSIGSLELPAGAARLVYRFMQRCENVSPRTAWLTKNVEEIDPSLEDSDRVILHLPEPWLPLFKAMFIVARSCRELLHEQQVEVAKHVCEGLPPIGRVPNLDDVLSKKLQPVRLDLRNFFGHAYAACVYSRIVRAGFDCEFVRHIDHKKTPDLLSREGGVYVECKDALSDAGVSGSDEDVVRKLQCMIRIADQQLSAIDPRNEFEHVIALDLPEGVVSRFREMREPNREQLARAIFGLPGISPCGTWIDREPIIDNPSRVILTDFDFGIHSANPARAIQREPIWFAPMFRAANTERLSRFVQSILSVDSEPPEPIEDVSR
ncbi:MAG: hypothetical protein KIT74_00095 [Fimbriimonadales bacterium]|nr:hypothetical protein [Fimbriimonadales bacterium]